MAYQPLNPEALQLGLYRCPALKTLHTMPTLHKSWAIYTVFSEPDHTSERL